MVSRSGSPGPAPTSVTLTLGLAVLARAGEGGGIGDFVQRFLGLVLAAGQHQRADRAVDHALPETAAQRKFGNARMHRFAKAADEAGEIADARRQHRFDAARGTRRATTGDVPPVPTATTTSPRSTIAGKMKVECARSSITLTGRPTAFARTDIATPMSPAPAQRIAITLERSAASGSPAASSIRAASVGLEAGQIMIAVGGIPADLRARGNEQPQFCAHELARSNEQHLAALQIQKHRQVAHPDTRFPQLRG